VASLKPLKSVAHNLPHHFASTLNYWGDDYAIHHLAKAASVFPDKCIEIDVLTQTAVPPVSGAAQQVIGALRGKLSELMAKAGFDPNILASATLRYDFSVNRRSLPFDLPCYDCLCTLSTKSGRTYSASLTEGSN